MRRKTDVQLLGRRNAKRGSSCSGDRKEQMAALNNSADGQQSPDKQRVFKEDDIIETKIIAELLS